MIVTVRNESYSGKLSCVEQGMSKAHYGKQMTYLSQFDLKEQFTHDLKRSVIIDSPLWQWKVVWSFELHKTCLGLHDKTVAEIGGLFWSADFLTRRVHLFSTSPAI